MSSFTDLVETFLKEEFAESPVQASALGLTAYDEKLDDLSADAFTQHEQRSAAWLTRLRALPDEGLSPAERIDRDFAISILRGRELTAPRRSWQRQPATYLNPGLQGRVLAVPAPPAAGEGPRRRGAVAPGAGPARASRARPGAVRPARRRAAPSRARDRGHGRLGRPPRQAEQGARADAGRDARRIRGVDRARALVPARHRARDPAAGRELQRGAVPAVPAPDPRGRVVQPAARVQRLA